MTKLKTLIGYSELFGSDKNVNVPNCERLHWCFYTSHIQLPNNAHYTSLTSITTLFLHKKTNLPSQPKPLYCIIHTRSSSWQAGTFWCKSLGCIFSLLFSKDLISIFPEGLQLRRDSTVKIRLWKNPTQTSLPSPLFPSSLLTLASEISYENRDKVGLRRWSDRGYP